MASIDVARTLFRSTNENNINLSELIPRVWETEQHALQISPLTSTIRGVHCPVCARSSMTRKLTELCLEARLSSVTTRPPGLFWPPLQHNYHHPWQKNRRCKAKPEIKPLNQTKYEIRRNLILITGARRFEIVTVTCLCSETDWCALRGFYRGGGSWGRGLGWSFRTSTVTC